MHRILERQIQRTLAGLPPPDSQLQELLRLVSATYEDFDKDRILSERSLEISSKELRLAIAVMRTTLDSVGEGILVIDENQKIAYYNKRFLEIWNILPSEIAPHLTEEVIAAIIHKTENPTLFRQIVDQVNTGEDIGSDTTIKLNNQSVVALKSSPQLLEGKTVGRVWSFRDITKYVSFQEQIQDKVTTLERMNKTMVDRELKMIELKNKLEELQKKV